MKNHILRIVAIAICCIVCATAASAYDVYKVTSSRKLNVRAQPSTSAPIISQLQPGAEVEVESADIHWSKVHLKNGRTGYASSDYLKFSRSDASMRPAAYGTPVQKKSGSGFGFWGKVITWLLVFGAFVLIKKLSDNVVVFWICRIAASVLLAYIPAAIFEWIFDAGFQMVLTIGTILVFLSTFADEGGGGHSSSSDSEDINDIAERMGIRPAPAPRGSSSQDHERQQQERLRENRAHYERLAREAYSSYQSAKSRAENALSNYESELSRAEDYDTRAREYDEDSARHFASQCRSQAEYYAREARNYAAEADRYYSEYQDYENRARCGY